MLHLLDDALEALFRGGLPLDRRDVDVTFEAPTADWAAALTRPTVDLYLWGVAPSTSGAEAGMELREHEGRVVRRPALPRVDCSYLVSAWAAEPGDEHQLLSALLAIALTNAELPSRHLPEALAAVRPWPRLTVTKGGDERRALDVWSAMGSRVRPAVDLVVTAPLEAAMLTEAGPPVTTHEVVVTAGDASDRRRVVGGRAPHAAPGTVVRTGRGASRVRTDGAFAVPAWPGEAVVVESDPPGEAAVPEDGPTQVT